MPCVQCSAQRRSQSHRGQSAQHHPLGPAAARTRWPMLAMRGGRALTRAPATSHSMVDERDGVETSRGLGPRDLCRVAKIRPFRSPCQQQTRRSRNSRCPKIGGVKCPSHGVQVKRLYVQAAVSGQGHESQCVWAVKWKGDVCGRFITKGIMRGAKCVQKKPHDVGRKHQKNFRDQGRNPSGTSWGSVTARSDEKKHDNGAQQRQFQCLQMGGGAATNSFFLFL